MEQVAGMNNLVNEQKVCKHNYMPGTFSPSSVSQALRGLENDFYPSKYFLCLCYLMCQTLQAEINLPGLMFISKNRITH